MYSTHGLAAQRLYPLSDEWPRAGELKTQSTPHRADPVTADPTLAVRHVQGRVWCCTDTHRSSCCVGYSPRTPVFSRAPPAIDDVAAAVGLIFLADVLLASAFDGVFHPKVRSNDVARRAPAERADAMGRPLSGSRPRRCLLSARPAPRSTREG
jgi:hypothetical protein